MTKKEAPILGFATRELWEEWLRVHEEQAEGVWIRFAKKGSGIASVTHAEALEAAIAHGWIDAQVKALDERHWLHRFVPRRPRSKWSKVNCAKALVLIAEGRMQPTGLREVEAARRDGRWEAAYDSWSAATVPADLAVALAGNRAAREFFGTLNGHNRYAILHRIQDAKKTETRARRIAKFVAMLAEGKTIYPAYGKNGRNGKEARQVHESHK